MKFPVSKKLGLAICILRAPSLRSTSWTMLTTDQMKLPQKKGPLNCIMGKQYVTEETGRQQIFAAR